MHASCRFSPPHHLPRYYTQLSGVLLPFAFFFINRKALFDKSADDGWGGTGWVNTE
jgi:hypothetical protein